MLREFGRNFLWLFFMVAASSPAVALMFGCIALANMIDNAILKIVVGIILILITAAGWLTIATKSVWLNGMERRLRELSFLRS